MFQVGLYMENQLGERAFVGSNVHLLLNNGNVSDGMIKNFVGGNSVYLSSGECYSFLAIQDFRLVGTNPMSNRT